MNWIVAIVLCLLAALFVGIIPAIRRGGFKGPHE